MEGNTTITHPAETSIPSCESCRRRKLKCARQQPSCANCDRLGVACIYDHEKKKPGFKVGAVESLSRRLDIVEKALSISQQTQQLLPTTNHPTSFKETSLPFEGARQSIEPFAEVLSSLTKELHNLSATISATHSDGLLRTPSTTEPGPSLKRRRAEPKERCATEWMHPGYTAGASKADSALPSGLQDPTTEDIIDSYFRRIHPWISIVHEPSFRSRVQDDVQKEPLQLILRSMTVAAMRFVKQTNRYLPIAFVEEQTTRARREIILATCHKTSIENLQALLILIYVDMANDDVISASSLLGVVWKQVESLELHLERPDQTQTCSIFETTCMKPTNAGWIEREEWRRIFWNAFMLDRLCSAVLGHRPTFLGATTSRRLPVCSSFWYTNQPRPTPYLNLSNTWNAGIGDPMDSNYSNFSQRTPDNADVARCDATSPTSGVGSLAFYVEAMESMSLILSHFLSLKVNFTSKSDVSRWLTRFKELDLHLLRWKSRLPQQWVDSGVSRRIMPGIMDPAMTAANTTHNTCLILLHEKIAYPNADLSWLQLPSRCSADTCQSASYEVCTTLRKFLEQRDAGYPLSPQLGLCAFVSARSLLLHAQYYCRPLTSEFWLLCQSLDDMAQRWQATTAGDNHQHKSIFHRLAGRLRVMQATFQLNPSQNIPLSAPLYDSENVNCEPSPRHWVTPEAMSTYMERARADLATTSLPSPSELPFTFADNALRPEDGMLMSSYEEIGPLPVLPWEVSNNVDLSEPSLDSESLLAISETLTSQDFTSIDRIVTFDNIMLGSFF